MAEIDETIIEGLRNRGLTCSKIQSMVNSQVRDARQDRKDSGNFRNFGMNKQADLQERIAVAKEQSAESLRQFHKQICPLK